MSKEVSAKEDECKNEKETEEPNNKIMGPPSTSLVLKRCFIFYLVTLVFSLIKKNTFSFA